MKIKGLGNEYEYTPWMPPTTIQNANKKQVDGDNYKKYGNIQPWDVWEPWNLNGFQCNIIKYIVRYRDKEGIKDLQKALHYIQKLIEIETEKQRNAHTEASKDWA